MHENLIVSHLIPKSDVPHAMRTTQIEMSLILGLKKSQTKRTENTQLCLGFTGQEKAFN
jgi:hypothetical protein